MTTGYARDLGSGGTETGGAVGSPYGVSMIIMF